MSGGRSPHVVAAANFTNSVSARRSCGGTDRLQDRVAYRVGDSDTSSRRDSLTDHVADSVSRR